MTTTATYNKAQQAAISAIQDQFPGTRIVIGNSRKYITLVNPNDKGGMKYFVGKQGAIRRGKTVSDSFSLTDAFAGLVAKHKRAKADPVKQAVDDEFAKMGDSLDRMLSERKRRSTEAASRACAGEFGG